MVRNHLPPENTYHNLSESQRIWDAFIKDGQLKEGEVRPEIAESWKRCRQRGINPLELQKPEAISDEVLEDIKNSNKILIDTAAVFIEMLIASLKGSEFIIAITDDQGIILMSRGYADADSSNEFYLPGIQLCEEIYGTTAIGLVLKNKKPYQVVAAEHYRKKPASMGLFCCTDSQQRKKIIGNHQYLQQM